MKRLRLALIVLLVLAGAGYVAVRMLLGSDVMRATLERQLSARLGQPVHIGAAAAGLYPRLTVRLRDVTVGTPAALRVDELDVVTGWRGLLSRRIEGAEIVLRRGTATMPLPFAPLDGAASRDEGASEGGGFTIVSIREIAVRELTITDGKSSLRVELDSSIAGDRLDVQRLVIHAVATRIEAHGALTSLARLEGAFDAAANPLELDEAIAAMSIFSGPRATAGGAAPAAAVTPMRLRVNLTAPRGSFAAYNFTDLSTTADLTPGRIALSPLALRSFGGAFNGRIDVETAQSAPAVRLTGRIADVDVAQVLDAAGSPGGITGRLTGTLALTSSGADQDALANSSHGTIEAAITDGAIPGLEMVRTVVLAFGKPSGAPPAGSGSAFTRLGGTFAVGGGTVSSTNLAMASRDFDMAGRGSLKLASGGVEAHANVMLSRDLTAQAGTDLRRYAQEDGRVVIPATITGTLQAPSVTLDMAAATRRALQNELKRRATSFFDDLLKRRKQP